jgi:hypothetical protein
MIVYRKKLSNLKMILLSMKLMTKRDVLKMTNDLNNDNEFLKKTARQLMHLNEVECKFVV